MTAGAGVPDIRTSLITDEDAPDQAVLESLLGNLPTRIWRCLQPDHRDVMWAGDDAVCLECGLRRSHVLALRQRMTETIERRVRHEIAAAIEQYAHVVEDWEGGDGWEAIVVDLRRLANEQRAGTR